MACIQEALVLWWLASLQCILLSNGAVGLLFASKSLRVTADHYQTEGRILGKDKIKMDYHVAASVCEIPLLHMSSDCVVHAVS